MCVCTNHLLVCRSISHTNVIQQTRISLLCIVPSWRRRRRRPLHDAFKLTGHFVEVEGGFVVDFCGKLTPRSFPPTHRPHSYLKPIDLDPDKTTATGEVFPFDRKPANALRRATGINSTCTCVCVCVVWVCVVGRLLPENKLIST